MGGPGGERRGGAMGERRPGASARGTGPDRQSSRTVYVLPAKAGAKESREVKLEPVQVHVGISDGAMTEVLDGLQEGARVVTSMITPESSRPAANPFGPQMRRF